MADIRTSILRGTRAAARRHKQLGNRARIESEGGQVDVFGAIVSSGVPLLFKPLDGLLGAFLPKPMAGILVTSKRPLSVQRFTAAHELGHFELGHQPSLDDETILRRNPFVQGRGYPSQEREADAFASQFLLPRWLLAVHFSKQGWTPRSMRDPLCVYQLSLRLGASYHATCNTLVRYKVIPAQLGGDLIQVPPKEIKKALLSGYIPPNWWGDVWVLTERDEGTTIEGSRRDLFVLRLPEHSGAGFLWSFDQLNSEGFAVVRDERENPAPHDALGGHVVRRIIAKSLVPQSGRITLAERRPWTLDNPPLTAFGFAYDLTGPEGEGWSRAERRQTIEAA